MALVSYVVVYNHNFIYINNQLNNNILEYNEIDREQLCKIVECSRVRADELKKMYISNEKHHLKRVDYYENTLYRITDIMYVNVEMDLALYNEYSLSYYYIDTEEILKSYVQVIYYFTFFSLILFIVPIGMAIRREKKDLIIKTAGNEAILANKTMISITENIHHELNTPLEVIDNKIEKIHRALGKFSNNKCMKCACISDEEAKGINKLEEDFDFIRSSSEQIFSILEKMKGFKHLRYSNGNKTLHDIVMGSFKIASISNSNFDYFLDIKLKDYGIRGDLKNADLLSILLNHIKNSLEANASKIFISYVSSTKDFTRIRILDNGIGIDFDSQKNIFEANFSTKAEIGEIRGNGMYLNKQIIKSCGGDVKLIESSSKGTTIELIIPSKSKE